MEPMSLMGRIVGLELARGRARATPADILSDRELLERQIAAMTDAELDAYSRRLAIEANEFAPVPFARRLIANLPLGFSAELRAPYEDLVRLFEEADRAFLDGLTPRTARRDPGVSPVDSRNHLKWELRDKR
jgi:hypothetical protein